MDIEQSTMKLPNLEILEIGDDKIRFVLDNCQVHIANALRRILLAEIPTISPHIVEIEENTSPLPDEFIAHRIGMIPLNSNKVDNFDYTWDCNCDPGTQCTQCSEYFEIDVNNDQDGIIQVTSLDIRKTIENVEDSDTVNPIKFYSTINQQQVGIPIVKLNKNQRFKCKIKALKGYGKMHAKWSPVSVAGFSYEPIIKFNQQCMDDMIDKKKRGFVQSCPAKVYEINESTQNIEVVNPNACMYCDECTKYMATELINPPEGEQYFKTITPSIPEIESFVTIKQKQDRFIFNVEVTGALKPADVLRKAFKILQEKLNKFRDAMNNPGTQRLEKNPSNLQ